MNIVDTKVNMANIQFSKFKYFNREKRAEKQMLENGKNVKLFFHRMQQYLRKVFRKGPYLYRLCLAYNETVTNFECLATHQKQ